MLLNKYKQLADLYIQSYSINCIGSIEQCLQSNFFIFNSIHQILVIVGPGFSYIKVFNNKNVLNAKRSNPLFEQISLWNFTVCPSMSESFSKANSKNVGFFQNRPIFGSGLSENLIFESVVSLSLINL